MTATRMTHSQHNSTIHILIIEQESIIRLDLQKELERDGYTVRCAASLENIIQTIIVYKPQLIIADTPPDVTYLQMLRNTWPEYSFPIICTGTHCSGRIIKEADLNILEHFQKPFDPSEIRSAINNYFKISER